MRAAVLDAPRTNLNVVDLDIDPPRQGEVLVRVMAAGICHSDYHYIAGDLETPLPVILGHEGAGIVEGVGPGVDSVAPGDHVIFLWRPGCGRCEYCAQGLPVLCDLGKSMRATGGMLDGTTRLHRGSEDVRHFLGVSCFAERCVVIEEALVRIPDDVPFDVAAVLGCSVITGVGAVLNSAEVRPGDTVLIIGAGGIGLSCVMAARLAGASRVIVADRIAHKLELAWDFGATDLIDTTQVSLPRDVRRLTRSGVDHSFECIGNPQTIGEAVSSLRRAGTATIVGLAPPAATVAISPSELVLLEKKVQGSLYGSARPHADIPRLITLYQTGQLPLDKLITRRYPLEEINQAFAAMVSGDVARSVLVL